MKTKFNSLEALQIFTSQRRITDFESRRSSHSSIKQYSPKIAHNSVLPMKWLIGEPAFVMTLFKTCSSISLLIGS